MAGPGTTSSSAMQPDIGTAPLARRPAPPTKRVRTWLPEPPDDELVYVSEHRRDAAAHVTTRPSTNLQAPPASLNAAHSPLDEAYGC